MSTCSDEESAAIQLRRRGQQSWRLNLLSRELSSACAIVWRVTPPLTLAVPLQEANVRRQLFVLATVRACHGPFNAWLNFVTRSKRERVTILRPDAVHAVRSVRHHVDRRTRLASRQNKLDHWLRVLARRITTRSALRDWRARAVEWRRGRLATLRRQAGMLRCWIEATQAARLMSLASGRKLIHQKYASALAALRSAARLKIWLNRRRWDAWVNRAVHNWHRWCAETVTRQQGLAAAQRRHRRQQLARGLQGWQSAMSRCAVGWPRIACRRSHLPDTAGLDC